jgi:hypothetical protein
MGYIYLLQDGEDKGTSIYKIGRTVQKGGDSRKLSRLQAYNKGTVVYNTWIVDELHVNNIEKMIKDTFTKEYRLVRGSEWFEGDVKVMKKQIDTIIEQVDITDEEHISRRQTALTMRINSIIEKMNVSDEVEKSKLQETLHTALQWAMESGEYDPEKPSESSDDDSDECDEKEQVNNNPDHFNTVEEVLRSNIVMDRDKGRIIQCLKKVILHCTFNNEEPIWGNCDIILSNTCGVYYKVHPNRTLTFVKYFDPRDFCKIGFA